LHGGSFQLKVCLFFAKSYRIWLLGAATFFQLSTMDGTSSQGKEGNKGKDSG
jgi:hypothetical protein